MNKLILTMALGIAGFGAAFAADPPASNSAAQNQQATAGATNAGNTQAITFTAPAATTSAQTATLAETVSGNTASNDTIRNVPNVYSPPLVSSNDTCMGSVSAGAGFVGTGISLGTTWTDANCKMLKNARELFNMGMHSAAMALMCNDELNRAALEDTGYKCPERHKKADAGQPTPASFANGGGAR